MSMRRNGVGTTLLRHNINGNASSTNNNRTDVLFIFVKKKQGSMIRKYQNHTLQTNPRYREEEPQTTNSYKTSGRNIK